ncbi:MAG: AraC family transcriptional regulator [Ruthenibacterium sp.]
MNRKEHVFSVKLLLSYLSILALPLLAILVVYSTASTAMYEVRKEKMAATLQTTALEMQQNLNETANLGTYISSMSEFAQMQQLLNRENRRANFYEMYALSRTFPNYSLFNEALDDVYFFFADQDYVIRLPAVLPASERSYQCIGNLFADDYDAMQKLLGSGYYEMNILSFNSRETGRKLLCVAQSFPRGAASRPLGTMLLMLDDSVMRAQMASNLIDDYGVTLMIDTAADSRVINQITGANSADIADKIDCAALPREPFSNIVIDGVRYAVCCAQAKESDYVFYTLMPQSVLLQEIGTIRPLIILLCLASFGIGIAICIVLWHRRRALVLRYCRYEKEFGEVTGPAATNFLDGVHAVLDSVAEMQNTIRRRLNYERSSVIQRLLNGDYISEERLARDLAEAEIVLDGTGYDVVTIRFKRDIHALQVQALTEFHVQMLACVERCVHLPHYCCEPEDLMLALVVPTRSPDSFHILESELHTLEDTLVAEEHVEAYVGIGGAVSALTDLPVSYSQARSVCEYLQFYNMRMVMDYQKLPNTGAMFLFPMEEELTLIRMIEQGNIEPLRDLFSAIAHENFTARALSHEMKNRLIELVRCTAIRALRDRATPEVLHALGRADTLDRILALIESALPQVAKQNEAAALQQKDSKKERLTQLIEQNYARDDYTLACLASEMQVAETKLYKEFRVLFGVSFSEYLENLRIHKACKLLKEGAFVKDVSSCVGYSSDYSFRRAFKRVMGLAPSYYVESLNQ